MVLYASGWACLGEPEASWLVSLGTMVSYDLSFLQPEMVSSSPITKNKRTPPSSTTPTTSTASRASTTTTSAAASSSTAPLPSHRRYSNVHLPVGKGLKTLRFWLWRHRKRSEAGDNHHPSPTTVTTFAATTTTTSNNKNKNNHRLRIVIHRRMQRVSSRQRLSYLEDGFHDQRTVRHLLPDDDDDDDDIRIHEGREVVYPSIDFDEEEDNGYDGGSFFDAIQDGDMSTNPTIVNHNNIKHSLSCSSLLNHLKRKRSLHYQNHNCQNDPVTTTTTTVTPVPVPAATSTTVSTNCYHDETRPIQINFLNQLPSDILMLHLYPYCDRSMLQSLLLVNKPTAQSLSTGDAMTAIWQPLAQQMFPYINNHHHHNNNNNRIIQVTSTSELLCGDPPNTPLPNQIDATLVQQVIQQQQQHIPRIHPVNNNNNRAGTGEVGSVIVLMTQSDPYTVQFHGTTGRGDRCVRANAAFPTMPTTTRHHHHTDHNGSHCCGSSLSLFRQSGHLFSLAKQQPPVVPPFLMPVTNPITGNIQIIPTHRAYYEVTILPSNNSSINNNNNTTMMMNPTIGTTTTTTTTNNNINDCVAVGLALAEFRLSGRQPGWDRYSFGLHSDDGGLFHDNHGQMVRKYCREKFQPGDTIGCGIDYQQSCIFYTFNGQYTGTAFPLSTYQLAQAWYPTVGLDTNHPIRCNFGQEAFRYQEFYCFSKIE